MALDATRILIWEIDFRTGLLAYDYSCLAYLGLDATDALGTLEHWVARVHPDDHDGFVAMLDATLRPD
ncbi:hypothetical protein V6O07_09210, partial [Arthrospira platensis SPKY2]